MQTMMIILHGTWVNVVSVVVGTLKVVNSARITVSTWVVKLPTIGAPLPKHMHSSSHTHTLTHTHTHTHTRSHCLTCICQCAAPRKKQRQLNELISQSWSSSAPPPPSSSPTSLSRYVPTKSGNKLKSKSPIPTKMMMTTKKTTTTMMMMMMIRCPHQTMRGCWKISQGLKIQGESLVITCFEKY